MVREQFLIVLTVDTKSGVSPNAQVEAIQARLQQAMGTGRNAEVEVFHAPTPDRVGEMAMRVSAAAQRYRYE